MLAMSTVTTREAEEQLAALLERAAAGEEIVIEKEGKPIARLTSCDPPPRKQRRGRHSGGVRFGSLTISTIPLPPDIQRAFEGLDP